MSRSILYLQYTNPANYPPLEHSGMILSRTGWEVFFFGIQSEGESNKLTFPEPLAQSQTLWKHSAPGLRQKLHFAAFTLAALLRAFWQRPSWVYCSDLMSCPAAWLIGRLTRCRVLYHEHDSPDTGQKLEAETLKPEIQKEQSGKRKAESGSPFQSFLLWTRRRVGQEAELVVLPNEKRLELFVQATARQKTALCVYNCPRQDEVVGKRAEIENQRKLRLAFHGSINRDRLPLALLEAMSRFPGQIQLAVAGYETVGSKAYMTKFLQTAKLLGLGNTVEFSGALATRQDLLKAASRCDVGLAFMPLLGGDVNMANMTGASNKPFDYLACGLALLVSARPDWEEMFVRPGYGLACNPDDADSIAEQLRHFLEQPENTRQMGQCGAGQIRQTWHYESQFYPVLNRMLAAK